MSENEQRTLDSFTDGSVTSSGHRCPTCGRVDFDSRRALAIHHYQSHNETLAAPVKCEVCGDEFDVKPSRQDDAKYCSYECMGEAKKKQSKIVTCETCGDDFRPPPAEASEARFCSQQCYNVYLSNQWTESQNPRWKGGEVTLTCEFCGDEYGVKRARAESSRFCSMECKGNAYENLKAGENNPRWTGGMVSLTCEWCGDGYERQPAHAKSSLYCSRACKDQALTELTGQDHPNWQGGYTLYRALRQQISDSSWQRIRKKETADKCQVCGKRENLHLHHIVPLKRGGTNESWNLLTLCRSHHKRAEEFTKDCSPLVLVPSEL